MTTSSSLIALPPRSAGVPAAFANRANLPDMNKAAQQGILASFAVVGYKGRNWRLKYRGEDELLKDERGVPLATLDVVIVGVSDAISKQWYDKRYSEGDNEAPDCFSVNGVSPDAASPKRQSDFCAVCPQNIYGSRITENGKKAKACSDTRRLAVVPAGDEENETYGGPMLLRLPPTSLANLAKYGAELTRFAAQPYMVRTQLGFDYDVAYPLLTFKAMGWLDDPETCNTVSGIMDNPLVSRILETEVVEATHDAGAEPESSALAGGRPAAATAAPAAAPAPRPRQEAKAPAAAPAQAPAPVQAATVAAEPEPEPELDAEMAAMEAKLAAMKAAKAGAAPAAAATITGPTATAQATTQAAAPPAKKASPFGKGKAAATNGAATNGHAPEPAPAGSVPSNVQPAPADLESAIDNLLGA